MLVRSLDKVEGIEVEVDGGKKFKLKDNGRGELIVSSSETETVWVEIIPMSEPFELVDKKVGGWVREVLIS